MIQSYINFVQAQQYITNIEAIDYFFAKEMLLALNTQSELLTQDVLSEEKRVLINHVFMALSVGLRAGHTCMPFEELAEQHWGGGFDDEGQCTHQGFIFPTIDILHTLFTELPLSSSDMQPVVFDNNKLYIRRYYQFERQLAHDIKTRLNSKTDTSVKEIKAIINQLFPTEVLEKTDQQHIDWQKLAVANAINKNFTVIAGGPGTGKTYTVTKLLAALLMLHQSKNTNQTLEIALVAPTGKAAQRLSESIIKAIAGFKDLIDNDILATMPTQAKTIHRLLGVIPNSPNFRHNHDNLLSCDVLLIDEVSMVDLPMMTRICRALKPTARIILLGDADQLPSVAVGSVLADIAPRPHSGYSDKNLHYLTQVCQLTKNQLRNTFENAEQKVKADHDYLSFLMQSRRFDGEGGIGKLAAYVIKGQASESWQLLESSTKQGVLTSKMLSANVSQLTLVDNELSTWLTPLVNQYYQGIADCNDISDAFILLSKFRVLCATRQGELGVDALNQWIKNLLVSPVSGNQSSYHGMPIMINENDYRLGLFNGDIGLLWQTSEGHLMAFFETSDHTKLQTNESAYKILLPSRLPKFDAVYAMTIHKTQGSEFEHVAIILPKQAEHQLLSRELLYTGITRAKEKLTLSSNKKTWQFGVKTAIKRYSGLIL